eukprot:8734479-Prorocentrum_lima.AAC.1
MTSSLVGSEMCIRDRVGGAWGVKSIVVRWLCLRCGLRRRGGWVSLVLRPVSYTHLTLPTICSV